MLSSLGRPSSLLLSCSFSLSLALALAALSACPPPIDLPDNDDDNGEGEGEPDLVACESSAQCEGGQRCASDGFCRDICDEARPCPAALPACDPVESVCVACIVDEDCGTNERCTADHRCEFSCTADDACSASQACDEETGTCFEKQCTTDGNCPGGFICTDFRCHGVDTCTVTAAPYCVGDDVRDCPDGTETILDTCSAGNCVDDPLTGAFCDEPICTPDARRCVDSATVGVCDASGSAETSLPCGAGKHCEGAGNCVDDTCVPQCGARECGLDPVCGTPCGAGCNGSDVCDGSGQCQPTNPNLELSAELSWTAPTSDFDLYVSRRPTDATCTTDTCYFDNCAAAATDRPDWDNSGTVSVGDPELLTPGPVGPSPERTRFGARTSPRTFRVSAHHARGNGNATATIRILQGGSQVASFSRSVAVGTLWKGVVVAFDGQTLHTADVTDDAQLADQFSCTTPSAPSCTTDADCEPGEFCDGNILFGSGTCRFAQCADQGDCPGLPQCDENRQCSLGVAGVDQACGNGVSCLLGLECSFLTNVCVELCPSSCLTTFNADCCPVSGLTSCVQQIIVNVCQ